MEKIFGVVLLALTCLASLCNGQVVTSVSRTRNIVSGGLEAVITGTGFTSTQSPLAVVTMYYLSNGAEMFRGDFCRLDSATQLTCKLPGITYPSGYTPPDVENGENARLNEVGVLRFQVGVSFSTTTAFEEFQEIGMYANPTFEMHESRTFNVWTYRYIRIQGMQITSANTFDDYTISITDKVCDLNFINVTVIECILPITPPAKDAGNFSTIRVHVGGFEQIVGQIWYRVPMFANGTDNLPVLRYNPLDYSSELVVNGEGVMVGLTEADYEVRVGQEYCSDIFLTPTSLRCRGPALSPDPTSVYRQHGNHYPQLIIRVPKAPKTDRDDIAFFQYEFHPAYVRYLSHNYSQDAPITSDVAGPGSVLQQNIEAINNANDFVQPTEIVIIEAEESNSENLTPWIILAACLAFGLFMLMTLCCCCFCPGCCACRRRWYYYEKEDDSRLVSERSYPEYRSARGPDRIVAEYRLTPTRPSNVPLAYAPTYF